MKNLKSFLLAACVVATTMGVSLSANATPISITSAMVTQDIYVDMDFADANPFGITADANQLIGSFTYEALDANEFGELDITSTLLDLSIGSLLLGLADGFDSGAGVLIAGIDTFNPFAGLDFFEEAFELVDDFVLFVSMGAGSGQSLSLEDANGDVVASGFLRLGEASVEFVSEPSVLIMMLLSAGFLVRRKISAK